MHLSRQDDLNSSALFKQSFMVVQRFDSLLDELQGAAGVVRRDRYGALRQ
jgi:hypothetical protein